MSAFFVTFYQSDAFAAANAAEGLMKRAGFSVGSTQRGAPTACMFGDYAVSKWRNLNRDERRETHALIEGDRRQGPVRIRLLSACPEEAIEALNRETQP